MTEDTVGLLHVSDGEIDVPKSIEGDDSVFLGLLRFLVAVLHGEHQGVVVVLGSDVVDAESPIVGSHVVKSLHHFDGVGNACSKVDGLLVIGKGKFEVALVAVVFSCFLCCLDAVEEVG